MFLWLLYYLLLVCWQVQLWMINKYFYIGIVVFLLSMSCDKQHDYKKEYQSSGKGYDLYIRHACNTCHSLDGSRRNGPTFRGLYGKKIFFYNDKFSIADEDYLINSILNPSKEIVKGYPDLMPTYNLEESEINELINFIKEQ